MNTKAVYSNEVLVRQEEQFPHNMICQFPPASPVARIEIITAARVPLNEQTVNPGKIQIQYNRQDGKEKSVVWDVIESPPGEVTKQQVQELLLSLSSNGLLSEDDAHYASKKLELAPAATPSRKNNADTTRRARAWRNLRDGYPLIK